MNRTRERAGRRKLSVMFNLWYARVLKEAETWSYSPEPGPLEHHPRTTQLRDLEDRLMQQLKLTWWPVGSDVNNLIRVALWQHTLADVRDHGRSARVAFDVVLEHDRAAGGSSPSEVVVAVGRMVLFPFRWFWNVLRHPSVHGLLALLGIVVSIAIAFIYKAGN